jgi:integrase
MTDSTLRPASSRSGKRSRITQTTVGAAIRRDADGAFKPAVVKDDQVNGLALHVTTRRAFWALTYQPHGINPSTGKRWGGGTRFELGDAFAMPLADARTAALVAKAKVRAGGDPLKERMRARAEAIALRELKAVVVADLMRDYEQALLARHEPSEASRRQSIHYAKKAVRLMRAETLAIGLIDVRMVRGLVESMRESAAERRHVFHGLLGFLDWLVRQGVIELNPCARLGRSERPRPGKARDHVPSLDELRRVWAAVEDERMSARDLVRFLLLTPLRLAEGAGLRWSEVDLRAGWIKIAATRMKNRQTHELPLSSRALAIVQRRLVDGAPKAADDLVFPSGVGKPFDAWDRIVRRIRKRLCQHENARENRFSPHDVRRAFVTHLADRFDENLLDLMLAHRPASRLGASAAYQKAKRLPERVPVMAAWARMVLDEESSANVIPLTGRLLI